MVTPSVCRTQIGAWSTIGSLDMITPAACTPICRTRPSTPLAVSMTFFTSGSFSYIARISPASL